MLYAWSGCAFERNRFVLNAQEKQRVLRVLDDLLAEEQEEKFLLYNMNIYLAMQLHALYCRYAMERKKKEDSEKDFHTMLMGKLNSFSHLFR